MTTWSEHQRNEAFSWKIFEKLDIAEKATDKSLMLNCMTGIPRSDSLFFGIADMSDGEKIDIDCTMEGTGQVITGCFLMGRGRTRFRFDGKFEEMREGKRTYPILHWYVLIAIE